MRFKPKTQCNAPSPCASEKPGYNGLCWACMGLFFDGLWPQNRGFLTFSTWFGPLAALENTPCMGFFGQKMGCRKSGEVGICPQPLRGWDFWARPHRRRCLRL